MNSSGRLRCKMQVVKLAVFGVPPERDMRYVRYSYGMASGFDRTV